MQFKALFIFALPVLAAPAPIMRQAEAVELAARDDTVAVAEEGHLEKREIITGIVTTIAISVGSELAVRAARASINLIKNIKGWTSAREQFTKATVDDMWANNPDPAKYPAVICNNVGYELSNPSGITGLISAKLKRGPLHTDYDCFYMTKANTFQSKGHGGFINLAIKNSPSCKFTGGKKKKPSLVC
ncbi:hypothetical protein MAPG_09369 [Magnaporthiopsis poae ATCC 64411]|uniref:DUF7888 domain-containing protein n=1 Tax=Magnaporthiopsis poae (strain ATCC 64411 / 73-15) TaxID=644358 RepID=A0A0C4E9S2_MAGP6|nr:hypothetical protein MAPG_09369 [Magnaporthiopsis poae ATCC 64411]